LRDSKGTILARYPDPDKWLGQSVPDSPLMNEIIAQHGEGTAETTGLDGLPRLFAFTPIDNPQKSGRSSDVYVSVGIPTSVAYADADVLLAHNLAALGLATLLGFVAAWVAGDHLVLRAVNALVV